MSSLHCASCTANGSSNPTSKKSYILACAPTPFQPPWPRQVCTTNLLAPPLRCRVTFDLSFGTPSQTRLLHFYKSCTVIRHHVVLLFPCHSDKPPGGCLSWGPFQAVILEGSDVEQSTSVQASRAPARGERGSRFFINLLPPGSGAFELLLKQAVARAKVLVPVGTHTT